MSRFEPPPPEHVKQHLFSEDFYKDIAHKMDPDQEITPEALSFYNDIADDFFQSVLRETYFFVREKNKDELNNQESLSIQAEDIYFILRTRFNMTNFPGGNIQSGASITMPTTEYKEKLQHIRQFSATHRDD